MAQFVAFDPHVEVIGIAILAVTEGMTQEADIAHAVMAAHGLDPVVPDQWYSQQEWLYVLKEIAEGANNAMFNLVSIGMKIPENALFPPGIDSAIAALQSIDVAYHMNHRGGEIGNYKTTVIDDRNVDFLCENPYPDDFDYGIIYGMARRFCPPNLIFSVYHDNEAPCRKKGANSCTYHVVFKPR
jgi:hypothetical protein